MATKTTFTTLENFGIYLEMRQILLAVVIQM